MDSSWLYAILVVLYGTIWFTHFTDSAASRPAYIVNVLYFILVILSTNSDLDTLLIVTLGVPSLIPLFYSLGDSAPVDEGYAAVASLSRTFYSHNHVTALSLADVFSQLVSFVQHSFAIEDPYDTMGQPKHAGLFLGYYDGDELDLEQGRDSHDKHEFFHQARTHGNEDRSYSTSNPDIHDSINVLRTYLPQLALSNSDNLLFSSSSTIDIISDSLRDVQNFLGASAPSTESIFNKDIVALFDKSFHTVPPSVSLTSSAFLGDTMGDWTQVEEQDRVGDISTWTEDFSMDIKNLLAAQDISVVTDIDNSFLTSPAPPRTAPASHHHPALLEFPPPITRLYEEDTLSPSSSRSSFSVFGYNDPSLSFDLPEFPPSESEQNVSVSLVAITDEENNSQTQNKILDIALIGADTSLFLDSAEDTPQLGDDDYSHISCIAISKNFENNGLAACCVSDFDTLADFSLSSGSSCISVSLSLLVDMDASLLLDTDMNPPELDDGDFVPSPSITIDCGSSGDLVSCNGTHALQASLPLSGSCSLMCVDTSLFLHTQMDISELGHDDFGPSLSIIMSMDKECNGSIPAWSPGDSNMRASFSVSGSCSSVDLSFLLDTDVSLLLDPDVDVPALDDRDFATSPSTITSGNLSDALPSCLVPDHSIVALASFPSSSSSCSSVNLSLVVDTDISFPLDASIDVPMLEATDFSPLQLELVKDGRHAGGSGDFSSQGAALSSHISTSSFILMDNCVMEHSLVLDAELELSGVHEDAFSSLPSVVSPSASFSIPVPSASCTWLMDVELDLSIGFEDDFSPLPTPITPALTTWTGPASDTSRFLRSIPLPPLPSPYTPSRVSTISPPKTLLQEILESSDLTSSPLSFSPFSLHLDRLPSLSPSSSISSLSTLDSPSPLSIPTFVKRKVCNSMSASDFDNAIAFDGLSMGSPSPYFWGMRMASKPAFPKGPVAIGQPTGQDWGFV